MTAATIILAILTAMALAACLYLWACLVGARNVNRDIGAALLRAEATRKELAAMVKDRNGQLEALRARLEEHHVEERRRGAKRVKDKLRKYVTALASYGYRNKKGGLERNKEFRAIVELSQHKETT